MNSIFFLNFIFKYFYLILKKLNQIHAKKKKKMQFNITKTVLYSSIQEEYK